MVKKVGVEAYASTASRRVLCNYYDDDDDDDDGDNDGDSNQHLLVLTVS